MPKQRITKEMIVDAAFHFAREGGMEQVLVKQIASYLGCSVQPIYSYCENMEDLRNEVVAKVKDFVREYVKNHLDQSDPFRSSGQIYIQLAKEEPHLYQIFILHERNNITSWADLYAQECSPTMAAAISEALGMEVTQAQQLHLHMLIYTIGLGAIFAMCKPGIPPTDIFAKQTAAYQAFYAYLCKET